MSIIIISPPDYRLGKYTDHGSTIDITLQYKQLGSEEILSKDFTITRDSLDEPIQSLFHKYTTLVQEFANDNQMG